MCYITFKNRTKGIVSIKNKITVITVKVPMLVLLPQLPAQYDAVRGTAVIKCSCLQ